MDWAEAVHYKFSGDSSFSKNEMCLVRRSSGKLTLARVIGIAGNDAILQVEESPEARDRGGKNKEPALFFRVHERGEVGKLSMGLCAEALMEGSDEGASDKSRIDQDAKPILTRIGSFFRAGVKKRA